MKKALTVTMEPALRIEGGQAGKTLCAAPDGANTQGLDVVVTINISNPQKLLGRALVTGEALTHPFTSLGPTFCIGLVRT